MTLVETRTRNCDFCGTSYSATRDPVGDTGSFTHYDDDRPDSSGNFSGPMDLCATCTAEVLALKDSKAEV